MQAYKCQTCVKCSDYMFISTRMYSCSDGEGHNIVVVVVVTLGDVVVLGDELTSCSMGCRRFRSLSCIRDFSQFHPFSETESDLNIFLNQDAFRRMASLLSTAVTAVPLMYPNITSTLSSTGITVFADTEQSLLLGILNIRLPGI